MQGFSYVDIFATKGIEYLVVIFFLVALIFFWRFLNKPGKAALINMAQKRSNDVKGWFRLAKGLYYHQGHSWAIPEEDHIVKIGIDDFAQKLVGTPSSIELPKIGSRIKQGKKGWNLRIDSKSIPMLSPVDGEVIAINEDVLKSSELIKNDPYQKGWILKAKVSNWKVNLSNLLSGKLALAWMENTSNSLRERMSGDLGIVLQDGGLPVSGFARQIWPDKWEEVAAEFFLSK